MESAIRQLKEEKRLSRDQLIREYLPHVKKIVRRISLRLPSYVDVDDLVNAGIIGLIESVDGYDSSRDNKFMTYAIHRIKGAVLSELRAQDIHSRSDRKKIRELDKAYSRLEHKLGREVNDEEIAQEIGVDLEELFRIKETSNISLISLEEIGINSKPEKEKLLGFFVNHGEPDPLTLIRIKEIESGLTKAIEQLNEKEKMVLSLYYWEELTMEEIGMVLGITESRVSQIHSHALFRLRLKLKREGLIDS